MAELIFFLALLSPVALIIWLTMARRKAQAQVGEMKGPDDNRQSLDTVEEDEAGPDGLVSGRQHLGDVSLEPDAAGGEASSTRALQGRR